LRGKVKALSLVAKAILVLVCLAMIIPNIIQLHPSLIGADECYIILGGSMQPTLRMGDLVFTKKVDPSEIDIGDIVTVRTDSGVYTHRVLEKVESGESVLFKLKGDANKDPDSSYVSCSEVIGKTVFSLPTGYVYTKRGYALIVATPLMLLAFYQAIKIYKVYDRDRRWRRGLKALLLGRGGRRRRKLSILDTTSVLLLTILVAGGTYMMTPYFTSGGGSFFTDTESAPKNVIRAGTWKVTSTITCSVSDPTINLGEGVTVSGSITPKRCGVDVTLTYQRNGTTIERTVSTNDDGVYEYLYVPNEIGVWTIKASWNGDSYYYGATSEEITLTVEGT